jgi:hypothetical protein
VEFPTVADVPIPPSGETAKPNGQNARQVRPATTEDITNQETIEKLAARIWAAIVAGKLLPDVSGLMDELLESHLLDDDDEEADEGDRPVDQRKRDKEMLDEAIKDAFDKYPDINSVIDAVDHLPPNFDQDTAREIAQAAWQLRDKLKECPIGATKLTERFLRPQFKRMVRIEVEKQFKRNPKYSEHIRKDVPGTDITEHSSWACTSSKGTFVKGAGYRDGGGLITLFTRGWIRVCKDRIDPVAWSYQYGLARKGNRQTWYQRYDLTERTGKKSPFELSRGDLARGGTSAIKKLLIAGVLVVAGARAQRGLVRFLGFRPKQEIVRMPQVGFFEVDKHYIYVRSNETLLPSAYQASAYQATREKDIGYEVDKAGDPDQYGHQIKGTTADWQNAIAIPLRGNSNVALALATSFASPLIPFSDEQRGGAHIFGLTGSGKTLVMSVGESVYGLPCASQRPRSYGRTWGMTPTGFEDLLRFRNHAGLFIDDLQRVPRANRGIVVQMIYAFTQVQKARGGAWRLRDDGVGQGFLLSSGEDSFAVFVGKAEDREGRERRVPDIPAEVQYRSAFETMSHDEVEEKLPGFYRATMQYHGAAGRDWQQWLVEHSTGLRERIEQERQAFLVLPQVRGVTRRAQPQLHSVIRRFGLYAASLHLAIGATILPWTVAEADIGLIAVLERWVNRPGNLDIAGELARAADAVIASIKAALPDRFIHIHKPNRAWEPATEVDALKQAHTADFDGYVKPEHVLIRPEVFERLCNGLDREIANLLQRQGLLIPSGKGERSRAEQVAGKVERFVVLSLTSLTP